MERGKHPADAGDEEAESHRGECGQLAGDKGDRDLKADYDDGVDGEEQVDVGVRVDEFADEERHGNILLPENHEEAGKDNQEHYEAQIAEDDEHILDCREYA